MSKSASDVKPGTFIATDIHSILAKFIWRPPPPQTHKPNSLRTKEGRLSEIFIKYSQINYRPFLTAYLLKSRQKLEMKD